MLFSSFDIWSISIMTFLIMNNVQGIITATTTTIKPSTAKHLPPDAKCLLPKEPGPCRMKLMRFYFNPKTETCEEFQFGGCQGNENKFGFKETCERDCKVIQENKKSPVGDNLTSTTNKNVINAKPAVRTM